MLYKVSEETIKDMIDAAREDREREEETRCCECGSRTSNPEGICYQCQCELHAIGAFDMDGTGWT